MIKTKIAIDFGGEKLKIYDKNLGLVFSEPSLIAVQKEGKKYVLLSTGQKAFNQKFDFKDNQIVFSPIENGTIQSVAYGSVLLKKALGSVFGTQRGLRIDAVISVPSGLPEYEKIRYLKLCARAGLKYVQMTDCTASALLGSNFSDFKDDILVVDMGASKCDFEIFSNFIGQRNATLGIGGNTIKNAIINSFWESDKIGISDETAEILHKELSTLLVNNKSSKNIVGVSTLNGEEIERRVFADEIYPISKCFFDEILLVAKSLAKAHYDDTKQRIKSVLLTGGLAYTSGLEKFFAREFPYAEIYIEKNPENAVFLGLTRLLE